MWALRALMNAWQMYIIIIVYVLQLCPGAWTQLSSIGLITCAGRPKCLKCERVLTCFHEYVSALVLEATGCSHYTPWNKASGCILESPCLSVCSLSGVSFWVFKFRPEDVLWTTQPFVNQTCFIWLTKPEKNTPDTGTWLWCCHVFVSLPFWKQFEQLGQTDLLIFVFPC